MQKNKLENLIKDFSLEKLDEFLFDANFAEDKEDFSSLNSEDIFSEVQKLGEIQTEDKKKIIVATIKVGNDLSERSSRKKQYDLGKRILEGQNYNAGIFVFYDKQGSFRFSLIYPIYLGTKRVLNSFKRFTYFVSSDPQITNKTFLKQIGEGDFSTLEKIKEAFSVEKVTKEFFKEYKNLFEELVGELNENHTFKNEAVRYNINTENFAKKLLGQIVFLCFLQKKRWLGAPQNKSLKEGDENFLQNLFEKKYIKYGNFFNDVLEYLFYGALNKKSDKAGTFYRDYFKCQIPFLNGGLFDPEYEWQKTSIYLDDKIFKRILEVFNQYNFTVDENNPIDQEIAIDPEMLGKVFENLLNENLRKGKGTYYTPREIVHYMCQESLINYLFSVIPAEAGIQYLAPTQEDITTLIKHSGTEKENSQIPETISQNAKFIDENLASIKVCDPACGSGAFLVGMLQEIIKARQALQIFTGKQTSEYDLKKETIQNCIYGVDIDPGAIEIAKLRLWLSLVVDYELEEIEPLPNLDYKIMQGNSLLEELVLGDTSIKLFDSETSESKKMKNLFEEDKQTDLFGESDRQKAIVEKISKLHKEYFRISDFEKKKEKKAEIDKIEQELIEKSVKKEVERIEIDSKNIGNYIAPGVGMSKKDAVKFQKNLSKQAQIMNVLDEFKKTGVKPFFLWRLYFADVFEKGGFDVVIANPPYVDSEMMKKTNEKMRVFYSNLFQSSVGNWDLFIIFIEKGLNLTKNNGIISYIVPNKLIGARYSEKLRSMLLEKNIIELRDYSNVNVFKEASVYPVTFVIQNNSSQEMVKMTTMKSEVDIEKVNIIPKKVFYQDIYWDRYFVSEEILSIILKISQFDKLSLFCNKISVAATVNEAYEIKKCLKEKNIKIKKDFKKLINTGTIDRYLSLWGKKKTQYIKNGYEEPIILNDDLKKINLNRYQQANSSKIIIAGMTKQLECFYDEGEYIAGKSTTIILENTDNKFDLKFILAILNSKLVSFWYRAYFNSLTLAGGYLQVSNKTIEKIPVPNMSKQQQKPFINLVNQILKKKKDNPEADIGELERDIDEMVYELYDLAEEEIKIIEQSF